MSNTDNSVFEDFKRITSQRINWIEFLSSEDSQVVKYAIKNLLRLESINLSLTKLLLILLSQNKDNCPTYNEIIDKFRKIMEKIERLYKKIPSESELKPRLYSQSSICDCSKDFIFRVERMKLIFSEKFFKKIVKVGSLVHCYPEPLSTGNYLHETEDNGLDFYEPWMV
jgi:hypothetical protein